MKGGFFEEMNVGLYAMKTKAEKQSERERRGVAPTRGRSSSSRSTKVETCENCGLYKTCESPKMQPSGRGDKEILVVAEAPGETEDRKGTQLVGKTGQYFRDILSELDLDLDKDFWKTNALICRPPKNRSPSPKELRICRRNLLNTIEMYKPKAVLLVGESAFDAYMGPRMVGRIKKIKYSNWVGEVIPDQELGMWICPVYHPSYLVRLGGDKVLEAQYKKQLRAVLSVVSADFPSYKRSKVDITEDPDLAVAWIEDLLMRSPSWVAFDYETTGKKPHREGHRIVSVSFCDGHDTKAFSFSDDKVKEAWGRFLDSDIGKICHNMSFEEMWSLYCLGKKISGPRWDTMLAAHCLNNRKNVGLKFQVYKNLGVLGYDEDVDPYITTASPGEDADSANAFNRIEEAPMGKVLLYNGEDSFFTRELFVIQRKEFDSKKRLLTGARFFFESSQWLARAQNNGVRVEREKLEEVRASIDRRIRCIEERIYDSPEVKRWDGKNKFNVGSPDQLAHLLFDILEVRSRARTSGGKRSVDEKALEGLDVPLAKEVLEFRRWSKARKTYLGQYEREMVRGYIHPFFGLGNVDTFRSSSSSPNFQNVPKRDEKIKHVIRSLIVPRRGNRLVEYDFKQTEVCTAACYNKDPNLIRYIEDPNADMHRDMAAEIFKKDKEKVSKQERYLAKNGFVFPSFYGSFYEQTAPDMWKRMSEETRGWLREKGVRDFDDFESHVEKCDRRFWGERFKVYAAWKKQTVVDYEKCGYIDMYTDFRCWGPMKRNEVINYRVQGSAFHILLWTFVKVSEATQHLDRSFVIGQIHDSIVADVHPDDEKLFDRLVYDYGTKKVREFWPWIIVPLTVEKERSAVDGSWAEMESCGTLKAGE